jgi:hypothetical protein
MIRKVEELEVQTTELAAKIFAVTPDQYRKDPDPEDSIGEAWANCIDAAMGASVACERLGDLLWAKAGIKRPRPTAECLADSPGESDDEQGVGEDGQRGSSTTCHENNPIIRRLLGQGYKVRVQVHLAPGRSSRYTVTARRADGHRSQGWGRDALDVLRDLNERLRLGLADSLAANTTNS